MIENHLIICAGLQPEGQQHLKSYSDRIMAFGTIANARYVFLVLFAGKANRDIKQMQSTNIIRVCWADYNEHDPTLFFCLDYQEASC